MRAHSSQEDLQIAELAAGLAAQGVSETPGAMRTEDILMQLVQATQMVATRTSLVHVGAPSHLGQLLPTALQLWSQDRLSQHGKGLGSIEASSRLHSLRSSYSEELRDTAVKLATEASLPDIPSRPVLLKEEDPAQEQHSLGTDHERKQPSICLAEQSSARREGCPSSWKPRPNIIRQKSGLASNVAQGEPSQDSALLQSSSEAQRRRPHRGALDSEAAGADYLTIEEDEQSSRSAESTLQRAALEDMSAAGQQLLLLLRVLRNLCATGSDATRAMADVGVPAQVARLISEPLGSNQQGDTTFAVVLRAACLHLCS